MQPINTAFEQLKAKFLENELECSYCHNVLSLIRCAVYRKVSSETVLYTFTYNRYLNDDQSVHALVYFQVWKAKIEKTKHHVDNDCTMQANTYIYAIVSIYTFLSPSFVIVKIQGIFFSQTIVISKSIKSLNKYHSSLVKDL